MVLRVLRGVGDKSEDEWVDGPATALGKTWLRVDMSAATRSVSPACGAGRAAGWAADMATSKGPVAESFGVIV